MGRCRPISIGNRAAGFGRRSGKKPERDIHMQVTPQPAAAPVPGWPEENDDETAVRCHVGSWQSDHHGPYRGQGAARERLSFRPGHDARMGAFSLGRAADVHAFGPDRLLATQSAIRRQSHGGIGTGRGPRRRGRGAVRAASGIADGIRSPVLRDRRSVCGFAVDGEGVGGVWGGHGELLTASDRLFSVTADLFADSRSILLLTNQDGVILKAAGDLRTLAAGEKIHLTSGGDWRENRAGTNGIGTTLATGQPTYIHGAEHFCEGIKSWSCAAAPIFEPGTGKILGVLDISGPPSTYHINNLTLAVTAAHQIQMVVAEQATREHVRLLSFCLQRLSSSDATGMVLIDRAGRLVHTTSRVPLPVGIGEGLPGMDEGTAVEDWAQRLPKGLHADGFSPVVVDGSTIGAMLVVPMRSRPINARIAERSDEADPQRSGFAQIQGQSAAILAAINRGRQLARKRVPVLIEGETGVGKELFARAIHGEEGGGGPFVAYNCGAASKELIASELFGHVRRAFTGAMAGGRPGRFELAHGGTLCLDEIGEMPLELQPVLLRALEEGIVYRLGDTQPRRVDVRLLAMTNRNL